MPPYFDFAIDLSECGIQKKQTKKKHLHLRSTLVTVNFLELFFCKKKKYGHVRIKKFERMLDNVNAIKL